VMCGACATACTSSGQRVSATIGTITIAYGTGSAATDSVAGSPYTGQVTASAATGGTFSASNYTINYTAGTIIVNPANVTVTANRSEETRGRTLPGREWSAGCESTWVG